MSFLDHLEELRRRIIKSVIAVAVGVLLCTTYTPAIIRFLKAPAAEYGIELVGYGGLEMFSIYFHVGLAAGLSLAAPVILFQAWRFIEPALYPHEKRWALPFLGSTTVFFILGAIFGYAVAMPYMMQMQQFLANLMAIRYNPSAIEYIKLLTATVIAMGAVFEMPPIVFILSRIGLVNARFLVRNMNHAFVILLILAAILTPTGDLGPTIAFVAVMMGLYLFSILVALCFGKKRTVS
jgi:sec-independent protein translocase protein TatC